MLSIKKVKEGKNYKVRLQNGTRNEHTYAKPIMYFDKAAHFLLNHAYDWWWWSW